jgi:opacity protein-like surface antigen
MRKLLFMAACLMFIAPAVFAQADKRVEFFVGYSNLQAEGIPDPDDPSNVFDEDFFDRRRSLHGFNASAAGYFNSVFGFKGDFSFHRNEDTTSFTGGRDSVESQVYYFMGGPVVKFTTSARVAPFAHALFGGAHNRFEVASVRDVTGGTVRNTFDVGRTDFALAVGGGVDIRVGERVSVRAIQVDYAPTFLGDRTINLLSAAGALVPVTLEGQRQDNIRFSVGIVF